MSFFSVPFFLFTLPPSRAFTSPLSFLPFLSKGFGFRPSEMWQATCQLKVLRGTSFVPPSSPPFFRCCNHHFFPSAPALLLPTFSPHLIPVSPISHEKVLTTPSEVLFFYWPTEFPFRVFSSLSPILYSSARPTTFGGMTRSPFCPSPFHPHDQGLTFFSQSITLPSSPDSEYFPPKSVPEQCRIAAFRFLPDGYFVLPLRPPVSFSPPRPRFSLFHPFSLLFFFPPLNVFDRKCFRIAV